MFGMIERGGVQRSGVVRTNAGATLMSIVLANLKPGTTISTDRSHSYICRTSGMS
jgi:hypothetical protein